MLFPINLDKSYVSKSVSWPAHFLIFHKDQETFAQPNLFLWLSETNYFLFFHFFMLSKLHYFLTDTSSVNQLTFLKENSTQAISRPGEITQSMSVLSCFI